MDTSKLFKSAIAGVTVLAVGGCGADSIASPGEGQIVVLPAPTPPPPPPPPPPVTPTPTPTPTGPASSCPTGTADVGTITTGNNQSLRNCQLSGNVLGSLRIRNLPGTIYSLSGKVQVGQDRGADSNAPAGAAGILTIDAGTVLFGASGADFLVVNRGSQLFTDGNAQAPIVMTSRNNVIGQSADDSIGEWGGLVILGRAPIADCADQGATGGTIQCQAPVEGTAGSVYGGATANDNSGSLRYLEVRFSGFQVDTNNELNGITLAGVGTGTTVEYVSVHNSSDDGIEWFGGTVNSRYLVLTGNDDDDLDQDSGFVGNVQYAIVTKRAGGGDSIIEFDSTDKPRNAVPRTDVRMSNITGVSLRGRNAILVRGGGDLNLSNSVVVNRTGTCLDIDDAETAQAASAGPDENGPPVFNSVAFDCMSPFVEDTNVTAAQVQSIFTAGTNNRAQYSNTLSNVFINGANETAITPFNAMTLAPFFMTTSYVGAVRDSNDNWWRGWACGLGLGNPSCTAIAAPRTTADG